MIELQICKVPGIVGAIRTESLLLPKTSRQYPKELLKSFRVRLPERYM